MSILTPLHLTLLKDILRMSLSEYAEVRIKAQSVLSSCVDTYLYAGRKILPDILPFMKSEGVSHEQFKGALHVMLLPPVMNMYVHDWAIMAKTLPAFVVADHSEKMSILVLLEKIVKEIHSKYQAFSLRFEVPSNCHFTAASLCSSLSDEEKEKGKVKTEELNCESVKNYEDLIQNLVILFEQEKLQWRHSHMAMRFLKMLIRHDHPLPTSGVKLIVSNLTNDAVAIRKMAISGLVLVLQQQKRKHRKVPVDVEKKADESINEEVCHGERSDIKWLCYDPEKLPLTEDQWNEFTFIDKTHWGYYCWPKTLLTYVKSDAQNLQIRSSEELSESEKVIFDALTSSDFVQKLFSYLSLEESKGKDKYSIKKFTLFKYIFRNYGSAILPHFKPHLERLSVDSHESCQRCAAEVIAGLASGSKLWTYDMVKDMQDFLQPLFKKILEAVTVETVEDWASCLTDISANRDPRRIHWLLQVVMCDPVHGQNGSFLDASRLYLLQTALAQQEWRVPSLQHELLGYLKQHLSHSFKNVRERIGSVLSQIFLYDVTGSVSINFNPSRKEFYSFLHPMLPSLPDVVKASSEKDQSVIKFYETVLIWIATSYFFAQEHFQLLFQLLPLVTVEEHDEILPLMKRACAQVAHAEISATTVKAAFTALKGALSCELWKVRVLGVQLLQILIFENLFLFEDLSEEVTDALLTTISDSQMEVRDVAAATLGGLVHCGFIKYSSKLKDIFIGLSRTILPKNKLQDNAEYEDVLVRRHSGVLGLAALVDACPYSVPDWLPDVIIEIASHNHDPAPIQGTVKKVMSEFRRTHHDSWTEHKQKFTDDQLAVLTDLLVSPSYYA